MDALGRDVRHGLRLLVRAPGFTAVAVCILALGIGANTAIFSVINALRLRPLPVERPEELLLLKAVWPGSADEPFSYPAYCRFRDDAGPFASVLAVTRTDWISIAVEGEPELVYRKAVSGNYFGVLGVRSALGRTLVPEDDRLPGGQPVAVLSHGYWTRRFGRDPAIVGRTFTFKETAFTIVGVAAAEFSGETLGEAPDLWTPLTAQPGAPSWLWRGHSTTWLRLLARRRLGVTLEQARAGFAPIFGRVRDEIAGGTSDARFRQQALESRLAVEDGGGGLSYLRDLLSRPLWVLMAVVGLVLVIACANVATLLLARAAARRREIAVRLAIGAGRLRLVRQLLAEAVVLAALGGAAGLLLAAWGSAALVATASRALVPIPLDVGPDARVLAFTAAVSLLTATLFSLAPALQAVRLDVLPALKEPLGGGRGAPRVPLGRALVVAQMALSLLLLAGAALFVRSLVNLRGVDTGFDADRVLLVRIGAPSVRERLPDAELRSLYRRLLARAEAVPGVRAASLSFFGLFTRETWGNTITVEDRTPRPGEILRTFANAVSPRYFEVMGMSVLAGRSFGEADHERAPAVAVVNQAFARRFFGETGPIGRRVGLGAPAKEMMEIVGLVKDAKHVDLREAPAPMLYVPFAQHPSPLRELEVRTVGDPAAVASSLRRQLAASDPRVPVLGLLTLRERVDSSIVGERLIAQLAAGFGVLALALASVGLYGVMAYVVARRTAEIGLRMALGAQSADVRWLVLRETLTLVLGGVLLGVPAALAAGRLLESQLYGLSWRDPLAIIVGISTLSAAALAATYLPARGATRVDPLVALRYE